MKRLDLHIHTIRTVSDPSNFDFDIAELESYVRRARLDAIAITNHNLFDRSNYQLIASSLECAVFPGIEINVSTPGKYGHVIVIAPPEKIDEFAEGAQTVSLACPDKDSHMSWADVRQAFNDLDGYIVIPHYIKKKKMDPQTIAEIRNSTGIDALEVSNHKIWLREQDKLNDSLVVFSDARPGHRIDEEEERPAGAKYAYGYTYLDVGDLTVASVKLALREKKNVNVIQEDHELEILPEGLPVSRRLNVVLGERSSGKTFTLKRIMDSLEENDYFYLPQFHIAKNADEDAFNKAVAEEDRRFFDEYFEPFKNLAKRHLEEDPATIEKCVETFCAALIKYANSPTNSASDTPIFSSELYSFEICDSEMKDDVQLIKAVMQLRDTKRNSEIVGKYISSDAISGLFDDLRTVLFQSFIKRNQKERVNTIVSEIKAALGKLSSRKPLPETSCFKDYFKYFYRFAKTAEAFDALIPTLELNAEEDGKYKKLRTRMQQTSVENARKGLSLPKGTDVKGLVKAGSSRERLRIIRGFDDEAQEQFCKIVFKIDSRIVLNDGTGASLSGGQRAEYLLLHLLSKANGKDAILLDEPESSFDNPFLNREVCALINHLTDYATVFLVTHNNTLGISIHPDWVIYTEKTAEGEYKIYSGPLSDENLKSVNGEAVSRPENLLNILEAGIDTYEDRREYYGLN